MRTKRDNRQVQWHTETLLNIPFASSVFSDFSFPRHFHEHFVIEFVQAGADEFLCGNKTYTASTGDVVLINPGEVHTGRSVSGQSLFYYSLYPDAEQLKKLAALLELGNGEEIFFGKPIVNDPALLQGFSALFRAMENNIKENGTLRADLGIEQHFYLDMQRLLSIVENQKKETYLPDGRITNSIAFMHAHYASPVTLNELAAAACLNPNHFIRVFKKETGLSPHQYLLNLRLEHAKNMLRKNCSVHETAAACGFYDSAHFNRSFRKMYGVNPKDHRLYQRRFRTIFSC